MSGIHVYWVGTDLLKKIKIFGNMSLTFKPFHERLQKIPVTGVGIGAYAHILVYAPN